METLHSAFQGRSTWWNQSGVWPWQLSWQCSALCWCQLGCAHCLVWHPLLMEGKFPAPNLFLNKGRWRWNPLKTAVQCLVIKYFSSEVTSFTDTAVQNYQQAPPELKGRVILSVQQQDLARSQCSQSCLGAEQLPLQPQAEGIGWASSHSWTWFPGSGLGTHIPFSCSDLSWHPEGLTAFSLVGFTTFCWETVCQGVRTDLHCLPAGQHEGACTHCSSLAASLLAGVLVGAQTFDVVVMVVTTRVCVENTWELN